MVDVFRSRRWRSRRVGQGLLGGLTGTIVALAPALALGQPQAPKGGAAPAQGSELSKAKASVPATQPPAQDASPAPAPDAANPPADPIQTRRVVPNEVFKDPNAEPFLDIKKFQPVPGPAIDPREISQVKEMAGNPNVNAERQVIDRVVQGLAARLTDHRNIQALIAPLPTTRPDSPESRAIQEATANLLEPIFLAQSAKNTSFLIIYQRILIQRLNPLLKNHLVPRVQAMIVLGESASPEALRIYEEEINNRSQTLWVKLWALEGIANIKRKGGRLPTDAESRAGKIIADFLDRPDNEDIPWPVKLRALEALGALRQGFLPTQPRKADMANTAMRFLAGPESKLEVRSEAARALGLMQITTAVPKYNFALVAHAAGRLAADLGAAIDATFSASPPRSDNPTKARYLTALLIGPVHEAFDGVPDARDSGLLHAFANPANAYVRKVYDLIVPVAQTAVQLLGAPTKAIPDLKKSLETQVAALRDFLDKNPPPNRQLVQGGREFPAPEAAGARHAAPVNPVAGLARGR